MSPIKLLGQKGISDRLLDQFLREGNSINSYSKNDYSLLCEAILRRNRPLITACINAGASLKGSVHAAIDSRTPEILDLIIQAGGDVEELDKFGHPPLSYIYGTALPGEEGILKRSLERILNNAIELKRKNEHGGMA